MLFRSKITSFELLDNSSLLDNTTLGRVGQEFVKNKATSSNIVGNVILNDYEREIGNVFGTEQFSATFKLGEYQQTRGNVVQPKSYAFLYENFLNDTENHQIHYLWRQFKSSGDSPTASVSSSDTDMTNIASHLRQIGRAHV